MTPNVAVPCDIAYFIGHLKAQLGAPNVEFLTALVAALNDHAKLPDLYQNAATKPPNRLCQ